MPVESKLLNQFQWSWYHSFKKKNCYIFEYESVTENQAFRFLGDTLYSLI